MPAAHLVWLQAARRGDGLQERLEAVRQAAIPAGVHLAPGAVSDLAEHLHGAVEGFEQALGGTEGSEKDARASFIAVLRQTGPAGVAKARGVAGTADRPLWTLPVVESRALRLLAWALVRDWADGPPSLAASSGSKEADNRGQVPDMEADRRAFGVTEFAVEGLASVADPFSAVLETNPVEVHDRRDQLVAEIRPPADVAALDGELVAAAQEVRRQAFGVEGIRLLRFIVTQVQRQHADQKVGGFRGNVRDIRVERGWSGLTELVGGNRSRVRDAADALRLVQLRTEDLDVGGLLTYVDRRGRGGGRRVLTLSAGLVLSPEFRPTRGSRLVPVPQRDPPLLGRGTLRAAQLRMQQLWLLEMRRGWRDLLEHRGLVLQAPDEVWGRLAERAGLPTSSLDAVLGLWKGGSDRDPAQLAVQDDLWSLGETWEPELEFLCRGARVSASAAARRSRRK